MKKLLPLGVRLLCYIYLVNVVLYGLSLIIVYNRILILGQDANEWVSWLVRSAFIFIPAYLFFRFSHLKKDAWFLAMYFHIFFLVNNSSALLEHDGYMHSLVRIIGIYGSTLYTPPEILLLQLNVLINLFILSYLYERRAYFYLEG